MNTMTYRDFSAQIEYSEDDGCFVGHLAGIDDLIGFHGDSVVELRVAFEEAVDDYLETCKRLGREPQRANSDKVMERSPKPSLAK